MEKKIAGLISYVFHPLLIPTYLLVLMLNLPVFVFSQYSFQLKLMLTAYVFLLTFFVPLMLMWMLKKNKIIRSFQMETRQERVLPLTFMSITYYITYYFLNRLQILNIYSIFLLGITLVSLVTLLINFKFKISLHMIGMGGLTGVFFGLAVNFQGISLWLVYLLFIISGVVAYARLVLTDHTVRQLFYGYLLGFIVFFFLMTL